MLSNKLFLVVSAGISAITVAGCWGDSARAQKLEATSNAASSIHGAQTSAMRHALPRSPRNEHGGQGFLSTYRDPVEGIIFRYPKNYLLEEGEVLEHSYFLRTQDALGMEQPGAVLVTTVSVPEDGYPNTTFEHGSLQLVTNDIEGGCSADVDGEVSRRGRFVTGEGLKFDWAEQRSVLGETEIRERHYAARAGERCYEFFATVAVEASADPNGFTKPADVEKIQRQLEKIIFTLRVATEIRD